MGLPVPPNADEDADVTDPWDGHVDIRAMTGRDFEGRRQTVRLNETIQTPHTYALARREGVPVSVAVDRALRRFLAHLIDTREDVPDLRDRVNVVRAIPPRTYIRAYDPDPVTVKSDDPTLDGLDTLSTAPAVFDALRAVRETADYERNGDIVADAVAWEARVKTDNTISDNPNDSDSNPYIVTDDSPDEPQREMVAEFTPLGALFRSEGSRKLTEFWMEEYVRESMASYSKAEIARQADTSRSVTGKYLPTIAYILNLRTEGNPNTRYGINWKNDNAEILGRLVELNQRIAEKRDREVMGDLVNEA